MVTVPMMHKARVMRHAAGSDFQAVEIPYVGGDLKMLVVLPAEGQLQAVRNSVDDAWFRTLALVEGPVDLSLPKFRISWGPEEFKETLAAMGMPRAFDEKQADFSHITTEEQLKITHILQNAFVGIDEFGTEAAAVSAVIGVPSRHSRPTYPRDRDALSKVIGMCHTVTVIMWNCEEYYRRCPRRGLPGGTDSGGRTWPVGKHASGGISHFTC
ncbi:hypothetical protein MGAST_20980 [Mycobacterium gastri 'Wayne']|uniref:Serpin domain-containing protein n=1 Tax=Mycobacterium gastri TaxID=1777 RepID=A0A1X1V8T7_MYCGS|nr:hypothetical protein MGAST_20980 [Mycobacterium gastri 'Wayne']ORV65358.1 hypothetical protein AWC07_13500 [Mycobacterium gastri]